VLWIALQVGIVSGRYDANDPASPLQLLLGDVGPMLKAAARQLADKSPKTRMGMFTVLRTLVGVLPGSVADHVGMLVPGASAVVVLEVGLCVATDRIKGRCWRRSVRASQACLSC
jgi:hypothetical protein